MSASSQTILSGTAPHSASRLARAYVWFKRSRASSRAGRSLSEIDAHTLRDIGITRRQLAVLTVSAGVR